MSLRSPDSARPVVVGVRGDQPFLLDQALELSHALGAPLRVVHAYWRNVGSADLYMGQDAAEILRAAAMRVLDDARERLTVRTSDAVDYALIHARPVDAMQAESENAALLVLGTDHTSWFNRVTGREVARHATLFARCPVAVVPAGPPPESGEVVAAIDLDGVAQHALGMAVDLSSRLGATLRIVSVVQAGLSGPALARQHARLDEAAHGWRIEFPRVDLRTEVIPADAVGALTTATGHARLMVVGRPDEPHVGPAFTSHVARSLLRTARCPVVVVPAERRRPRHGMP